MTRAVRARPDRVLILTTELGGVGGVQAVSRDVVRTLSASGPRVEVWSLLDDSQTIEGAAPGTTARGAAGSRLRLTGWALREALGPSRSLLVMVLHAHLAPLAVPVMLRGARAVILLHGTEVWRRLTPFERTAFERADLLIATSRFSLSRFRSFNPAITTRCEICPLSIPDVPDGPAPDAVTPRSALIVGRMAAEERYKGHDALLDVWPRVMARVPGATLTIAGDGDDRARLVQRMRDGGLDGHVTFTGRVSDAALRRLYQTCQVFVLPSRNEGFGIAFLEAMRAGRPCIGAAGAASEVIDDGTTGCIVDPDRPDQLEDALVRLLGDAARADAMGRAGRERVRRAFSAERFERRFRSVVEVDEAQPDVHAPGSMAVPLR